MYISCHVVFDEMAFPFASPHLLNATLDKEGEVFTFEWIQPKEKDSVVSIDHPNYFMQSSEIKWHDQTFQHIDSSQPIDLVDSTHKEFTTQPLSIEIDTNLCVYVPSSIGIATLRPTIVSNSSHRTSPIDTSSSSGPFRLDSPPISNHYQIMTRSKAKIFKPNPKYANVHLLTNNIVEPRTV